MGMENKSWGWRLIINKNYPLAITMFSIILIKESCFMYFWCILLLKDVLRLAEAGEMTEREFWKENKEEWMKNKPRKHGKLKERTEVIHIRVWIQMGMEKKRKQNSHNQSVSMKGRVWGMIKKQRRDFPGGPMIKTPCFQCRGCRLNLWWGN